MGLCADTDEATTSAQWNPRPDADATRTLTDSRNGISLHPNLETRQSGNIGPNSHTRARALTSRTPESECGPQCRLLAVSRSTVYYRPLGERAQTLALMRRINELLLGLPVLRQPSDDASSGARGAGGRSAPGAATDAAAGAGGDLPQAAKRPLPQTIDSPTAKSRHRDCE